MIRGSCLCGAVRYEVSGTIDEIHHCHCSRCRKAHGAAFSTYARVARTELRFVQGEQTIRHFGSSAAVQRSFCSECGSNLIFRFDGLPDAVWVAAGTFDDDPGKRPEAHIFVASKACWYDIADDLPRFDEYPPQG